MPNSQAPPRVLSVVGPEELLADREVRAFVGAVRDTDPATEVRDLSATSGLEPGTITALASPSLFDERKVIIVRGVQDASESLAAELRRYLEHPSDDVHLVLVHTGGRRGKELLDLARKAGAHQVDCPEIKYDSDKTSFVRAEFDRAGRRITPAAVRALVDAAGNDLRELASACSQLVADTEGRIGAEVVDRYYGGRVEVTGFKVADAAVEGHCEHALALLRHALASGVDPVPLNAALALALRNLAKVGGARGRPEDLARQLGLAPFTVRKARAQLPGWTPAGVEQAIRAVARADAEIKGRGADPVYALERAVVTIARSRAAAGP